MQHQKSSSPPLIFCAAARSDATWLAQWERCLLPLQQAGLLTIWSERHLLAGTSRTELINSYLQQAQLICFLVSADFFESQEYYALLQHALQRQQKVQPCHAFAPPPGLVAAISSGSSCMFAFQWGSHHSWNDPEQAFLGYV
jgi:hypothetical protein